MSNGKRIKPRETHRTQFNEADLLDDGTTIADDRFTKLGEYEVQAGEAIQLGYGQSSGQHSAEGRIYMQLQTSVPADIHGVLRFEVHNARDRHIATLWEGRTEVLETSDTDRRQQLPFPKIGRAITRDQKLVVTMMADTQADYDEAESTVFVDLTIHDVRE